MKHDREIGAQSPDTQQTLRRRFDNMHKAARTGVAATAEERLDRLDRLRNMLLENETAFVEAISADFCNRSAHESRLLDIVLTLNSLRTARKNLRRWMRDERRHVDLSFQPAKAWVRYEPLGVIGIISPWNYPIFLALGPLVDALAAGNRAMIKPSELTPRTSALLAEKIAEKFDETEVAVIVGDAEIAQAFSGLPFDHLVFTGSTPVGRKVMQAAAANLTPVTLELGGKSPVVVCDDYPLEAAARSISFGKYLNAGQTCISPDYALVPKDKVEEFAKLVIEQARVKYPSLAKNGDYTSIISPRHYDRLAVAISDARAAGARVLSLDDDGTAEFRKIPPTVVIDTPEDNLLLTEEIFGPILPIIGYETLDEVAEYINARDRPLALYAFGKDKRQLKGILDRSISGGVTLNGTMLHAAQESMSFGGVGASGIGGYHGHAGFKRFSHARSVHKIGFINLFEKLGPPWGGLAGRTTNFLKKRR
ncbi:coniferyl aldehyde dehydrogenase [Paracoccus tegillarcae]|uniref:Aldehyde dehydrogenase n=1 Tax=Paracoccus tegillarcae TaxID=1529068 RepID=A0A2K9EK67_9RHOB|nr:coniferyl aldehyde dehydrogenase [Paracoccus tegillarcae]AUH35430.1 coniferyl aldehyde dehydrogenase [Paracoccus tegillarcae]